MIWSNLLVDYLQFSNLERLRFCDIEFLGLFWWELRIEIVLGFFCKLQCLLRKKKLILHGTISKWFILISLRLNVSIVTKTCDKVVCGRSTILPRQITMRVFVHKLRVKWKRCLQICWIRRTRKSKHWFLSADWMKKQQLKEGHSPKNERCPSKLQWMTRWKIERTSCGSYVDALW